MRTTVAQSVAYAAPTADLVVLLEAIVRRERAALAAFYDQTHRVVFGLLCRILGERSLAEESLVAVYQRVWQEAAQFASVRQQPLTWLLLLARRYALAQRQTLTTKTERQEFPAFEDTAGSEADPLHAKRQRVQAALRQLTPEQRQAIELAFYRGLTESEIAARLGTSRDLVRANIGSGMRALRSSLQG